MVKPKQVKGRVVFDKTTKYASSSGITSSGKSKMGGSTGKNGSVKPTTNYGSKS